MKKWFTQFALAAAMLAGATTAQAQTELVVDGSKGYDGTMVQGQDYILPGTDATWYAQPGFFTHKKDNVWTFQGFGAPEYAYFFTLDEKLKYVKVDLRMADDPESVYANWDINHALYVNGENIGFPTWESNGIHWGGGKDVPVPQIGYDKYRMTLVIGQQLDGNSVNFKFFKGPNWGGDVLSDTDGGIVHMEDNPWIRINGQNPEDTGDKGNIRAVTGAEFADGDTLIVNFDMGQTPGIITVDYKVRVINDFPTFNGTNMTKRGNYFIYEGALEQGAEFTIGNGEAAEMNLADAYIDEFAATKLGGGKYKFNAVSGNYAVVLMPSLNYIKVIPGTYDAPATYPDGKAVWLIGSNVGQPSYAANNSNWSASLANSIPLAQVSPNVYKIGLTIGQEINAGINFKFFGQYGWGYEFHGEDLVMEANDYIHINAPEGEWTYDENGNEVYQRGGDDGNIFDNGASMGKGDKLVLTIDLNGYQPWDMEKDIKAIPGKVTVEFVPSGVAKPTFNGVEMQPVGDDYVYQGAMNQGASYVMAGTGADVVAAADFYYNPDYFKKNADGSFTFKALSGNYRIAAKLGQKCFHIYPLTDTNSAATFNDGAAMYANGGNGFGKPSFAVNPNGWGESNGWNPSLDQSVSLAQVADKIYTLTLTIGKQLRSGVGGGESFKFYGAGQGWDGELSLGAYEIKAGAGDQYFRVNDGASDTGNIFQVEPLTDGDTYVVILDRTGEMPTVTIQKATDETGAGVEIPSGIDSIQVKEQSADNAVYTLSGIRVANAAQQHGIFIQNGKKVVK